MCVCVCVFQVSFFCVYTLLPSLSHAHMHKAACEKQIMV